LNEIREMEMIPGQSVPSFIRAGRFSFPKGRRTYVMGILNVTPDSFSDGGKYLTVDLALKHAEEMLSQGADIIDIGGESTRPGSEPVSCEEELQRVIPVIDQIARKLACPISIDTYKPAVAAEALAAGASILNDINGLQMDPAMAGIACRYQAGVVIMHNARLYRNGMGRAPESSDLMADILGFLQKSVQIGLKAGLSREQLILDPGVGFGVTPEESIEMIARLNELTSLGLPILLGPSRKRFIGHILGQPATDRVFGTSAAVAVGIARGADIVRIHDVREIVEVVRVADALCRFPGHDKEG
jgi:dihydropteroate synthase